MSKHETHGAVRASRQPKRSGCVECKFEAPNEGMIGAGARAQIPSWASVLAQRCTHEKQGARGARNERKRPREHNCAWTSAGCDEHDTHTRQFNVQLKSLQQLWAPTMKCIFKCHGLGALDDGTFLHLELN